MNIPQNQIFNTVYKSDYLGLVGADGDMNYAKLAKFLDIDKSAVSKIAKISIKSVRYDSKIPKELQERLDQIANICMLVAEYFAGDVKKTGLWFKAKNPLLGNMTPRDMIRFGRYEKLMLFVMDALQDNNE